MVKIKRKVEMNLPQLIEWAWENDIRNKQYFCNENNSKSLNFNSYGNVQFSAFYPYFPDDTFTVEVEEEITEDTHLNYLYVLTDAKDVHRCKNFTIKAASLVIGQDDLTFFTLIGNDLIKIYDKGKLVE